MWSWIPVALGVGAAQAGCSTEGIAVEPDAFLCFGGGIPEGAREEGRIEIGTSLSAFEPIEPEQELALIEGIQGSTHFDLNARSWDLDPGDPTDTRAPDNPRTLFTAFAEDGTQLSGRACGWPYGYEPQGDYADISRPPILPLLNRYRDHYGKRARLVVEILDSQGRYARDEVWITAVPPDSAAHEPVPTAD
jgi:hypothetical protein